MDLLFLKSPYIFNEYNGILYAVHISIYKCVVHEGYCDPYCDVYLHLCNFKKFELSWYLNLA